MGLNQVMLWDISLYRPRDNPDLVEKSDREGFIDNPKSQNFFILTEKFRNFANDSLNSIRRAYNEFATENLKGPSFISAENEAEKITEIIKSAEKIKNNIKKSSQASGDSLKAVRSKMGTFVKSDNLSKDAQAELNALQSQMDFLIKNLDATGSDIDMILNQISQKGMGAELIKERLAQLNEQMFEVYENVGIGLAAQGFGTRSPSVCG